MSTIEQPGTSAMIIINKLIGGPSRILKHEPDKVNGWDIANCIESGWTKQKISKYIEKHMVSFDDLYEKPPGEKKRNVRKPFQCLGYNSNQGNVFYYYLPSGSNKIVELSPTAHHKMNLISLAPLKYWERNYPRQTSPDYTQAANDCIRDCEDKGIYDAIRVRGRGAWSDRGRVVLHMGDRLIVDGKDVDISSIDSYYIYEAGLPIENGGRPGEYLEKDESRILLDICKLLSWKNETSARLLAGWLALAPICGAIPWRPHVWLTGEAGTGKSWIQDNIVTPVLGRYSLEAVSASTEAGLRGAIGNDAIPITIDEMDVENRESFKIFCKILELARMASSNKGARIIKGTAQGGSQSYCIRSPFLLSSINTKMKQQSDESRFSILRLIRRSDYTDGSMFDKLKIMVIEHIKDDWCVKLRSRSVKMIPVIRKNIDVFSAEVAKVLRSNRHGEQIGTLLAGCCSLTYDSVVTPKQARKYAEDVDWENEAKISNVTDQEKLLYFICEQLVTLDQTKETHSIGALIKSASWDRDPIKLEDLDLIKSKEKNRAINTLRKYGITVVKDRKKEECQVVFAEKHSKLDELLRFSSWNNGYSLVLSRLPGAVIKRAAFAGGRRYRGIAVPYKSIITEIIDINEGLIDEF
jgi:putative DNA primase/helicase